MKKIFSRVLLCSIAGLALSAHSAEHQLDINRKIVNITGSSVSKIAVNDSIPGPTVTLTEGEDAVIHVTNHLNETSSIHWHGILLEGIMDGVPGFNHYPSIAPGKTFTYKFKVRQSGTYWYHAHTNGQEQDGLYGALIIKPATPDKVKADVDYVVLISEFTDEDSAQILANLKMSSDYYNKARRTVADFFTDVKNKGFKHAWSNAIDWGGMRMSSTDLSDVSGYTFLMNGKTPEQNWTGLFKLGESVRLRFINASAMSFYDVRIPGLKMTVIATDGQNVEPLSVDEFRFGVAETYDVIVTPMEKNAYTIVAESIDRTGFALGTLATEAQSKINIPKHRQRALLSMADMGMDMSSMDMSNMSPEEMEGMMNSGWADAGTPAGNVALDYADLRYEGIQKDVRIPDRDIEVRLGGNMERYIWTMNGKKFEDAEPLNLQYGERVRIKFINETMMAHPMHLHGMFVQLDNGQSAEKLPNKTVVIIPPGQSYSVLLTANEPGEWAFHCHLNYHMATGMMAKVVVAKMDAAQMPKTVLEGGVHHDL